MLGPSFYWKGRMKLSIPEIIEVLMTQAEDECLVCCQGHEVVIDDVNVWHIRDDGVKRECRAHQIHEAIKRFEALEDAERLEAVT